jgi:hypothetical protein
MTAKSKRRNFQIGDLVKQVNPQHPDYGKIGMITKMSSAQQTMRIAYVMFDEVESVWFMGDFVHL